MCGFPEDFTTRAEITSSKGSCEMRTATSPRLTSSLIPASSQALRTTVSMVIRSSSSVITPPTTLLRVLTRPPNEAQAASDAIDATSARRTAGRTAARSVKAPSDISPLLDARRNAPVPRGADAAPLRGVANAGRGPLAFASLLELERRQGGALAAGVADGHHRRPKIF